MLDFAFYYPEAEEFTALWPMYLWENCKRFRYGWVFFILFLSTFDVNKRKRNRTTLSDTCHSSLALCTTKYLNGCKSFSQEKKPLDFMEKIPFWHEEPLPQKIRFQKVGLSIKLNNLTREERNLRLADNNTTFKTQRTHTYTHRKGFLTLIESLPMPCAPSLSVETYAVEAYRP